MKLKTNENTKIKSWYMSNFQDDTIADKIKADVTFYDLFFCLDNYGDVYNLIGVGDSIVRERLFEKLADIMGVDYDYIYDQWVNG